MGLDCGLESEKFKSKHQAKGTRMSDWDAGFTGWLLDAPGFAPRSVGSATSRFRGSAAQAEEDRRNARSALFGEACDGFFGPSIRQRAREISSNRNIGVVELVDELERGEHQRVRLKLALP